MLSARAEGDKHAEAYFALLLSGRDISILFDVLYGEEGGEEGRGSDSNARSGEVNIESSSISTCRRRWARPDSQL